MHVFRPFLACLSLGVGLQCDVGAMVRTDLAWAESGPTGAGLDSSRLWQTLVSEAKGLRLPSRFLEQIPASFVTFEFEDLHAYAAEYHPKEHRMVLNRALSLNAAGRTLRPLKQLPHKDLETLYHELFHAYLDFLEQASLAGTQHSLLEFARQQQQCRYQRVHITPVVQKKSQTEERFLTETESWEALNETWAVFVGWAVWTQLEIEPVGARKSGARGPAKHQETWLARLRKAEENADLRGYYEPETPEEKAVARKRFLAPAYRISVPEVLVLMKEALGSPAEEMRQVETLFRASNAVSSATGTCSIPVTP